MDYLLDSEQETINFAKKIASTLKGGDIIALYGDLGAGKTTFVKGLAGALGIESEITSPTFVVLKEYQIESKGKEGDNKNEIKKLVHVDCYRFGSSEDAYSVGLLEYFNQPNVVVVIEWPEKIEPLLPRLTKRISFEYKAENIRKVYFDESSF